MEKQKKQRGPEVSLPRELRTRIDRIRERGRVGSALPSLAAIVRVCIEAGLPTIEAGHVRDVDMTPPPRAA